MTTFIRNEIKIDKKICKVNDHGRPKRYLINKHPAGIPSFTLAGAPERTQSKLQLILIITGGINNRACLVRIATGIA